MAAGLELARLLETNRALGLAACAVWLLASADGARRFDLRDLPPRLKDSVGPSPMWSLRTGELRAFSALSREETVCGVAGVGLGWSYTGGYTYLHRDVPLFDIRTKTDFAAQQQHFNWAVSLADNGDTMGDFKRGDCWGEMCLFHREGPCAPAGDYSINRWLATKGM